MLHGRIKWNICIVLLSLRIKAHPIDARCGDLKHCFIIYPLNNNWRSRYYDPIGLPGDCRNLGGTPPYSASSYVLMSLSEVQTRSESYIEGECLKADAKIAEINSNQEYNQLTKNILSVLEFSKQSIFFMRVQDLPKENITDSCGRISVKKTSHQNEITDEINIVENRCHLQQNFNYLICESISSSYVPEPTTITQTTQRTNTANAVATTSPITRMFSTTSFTANVPTTTNINLTTSGTITRTEKTSFIQSEIPLITTTDDPISDDDMAIYIGIPVSLIVVLVMCTVMIGFLVQRHKEKRNSRFSPSVKPETNIYADDDQVGQSPVSLHLASGVDQIHLNSENEHANRQQVSKPKQNVKNNQLKDATHVYSPHSHHASVNNECERKVTKQPHIAMKPPSRTPFKSKYVVTDKHKNEQQSRKVPSIYDVPVISKNKKDSEDINSNSTGGGINGTRTSVDSQEHGCAHHYENYFGCINPLRSPTHYDVPRISHEYENIERHNKSNTEHYVAPRVRKACDVKDKEQTMSDNEYELFDIGVDDDNESHKESGNKYKKGKSSKTPNVVGLRCDRASQHGDDQLDHNRSGLSNENENANKEQPVDITNAFYEALETALSENIQPKPKEESATKNKKSKHNIGKKIKDSDASTYMSYDAEPQQNHHYQDLDKSSMTIIKLH